ncbi:hypothetical protein JCM11641_005750 [Rhodosporidiobolus odoratus]
MAQSPVWLRGASEDGEEVDNSEEMDLTRSVSPAELLDTTLAPPPPPQRPPRRASASNETMRRPLLSRLNGLSRSKSDTFSSFDESCGIRSVSFGTFHAPNSFAAEWEREGRGVDRLLLEKRPTDGKVVMVVRMWDEHIFGGERTGGSVRISIEANTIDRCQTSGLNSTSLFLHLSRPPHLETFPPADPGGLKPLPRQVPFLDDAHALVTGYSSRVLRIKLRSRQEFDSFLKQAEEFGLPRFRSAPIQTDSAARFSPITLATLQSWMQTLDVRLAFQVEKLVRNGLCDAVKVLEMRTKIGEMIASRDVASAERVLALFSDRLAAFAPDDVVEELALSSDDEREPNPRPPKRPRHALSSSSVLSSSSDAKVEAPALSVPSPLHLARDSSGLSSSGLSVPKLVTFLSRAAKEADDAYHFLANADQSRLVRQVIITPTRILLSGPSLADSNSVTRTYGRSENFISVSVKSENGSRLRDREDYLLDFRYKALFRNGIDLAGRTFHFLAYSSSALKSASAFFMLPFEHEEAMVTPATIHAGIGNFAGTTTALIPAKYSARIAQAFSSSKPTLHLQPDQILRIDDISSASGSCFSDGVGLISRGLATQVVAALGLPLKPGQRGPTCFQFRLGGAKGMLQVDPTLEGSNVALRPSQVKFESAMAGLEIASTFLEPGNAFLNRPLITLLECLGVKAKRFLKLQSEGTTKIRKSRSTLRSAIKLASDWSVAPSTGFLRALRFLDKHDSTRLAAFSGPFVSRCLDATVVHALREIKHAGRIPLPGCFNLVGVLDVDGVLEENQIYARLRREDGTAEYIEGTIAISRSPTNHPGDCRLVQAVGRLEKGKGSRIRGLTNCVVFSSKGERSLPSMLAGGDLDGDIYLLLTEASGLLPTRIAEPAAYNPSPTVKLDREATVEDVGDFFFEYITRDRTGLVATRQLLLADAHEDGLFHPDCLKLAQLHSDCVDAAKSGHFVYSDEIPKLTERGWPDFLSGDDPQCYRSGKALGQLYRAIGEDLLTPPTRGGPRDERIDPSRSLTNAMASLPIAGLSHSRLPRRPSDPLLVHFRRLVSSFSSEFSKLAALSSLPRLANGRPGTITEEELFLAVTLGAKRLDKAQKTEQSRRREQVGELFTLARRLIRQGVTQPGGGELSTMEKVKNAWAAWMAAVEEGEERDKASGSRGKTTTGRVEMGLHSFAWVALGVLVEELEELESEQRECIVLSP